MSPKNIKDYFRESTEDLGLFFNKLSYHFKVRLYSYESVIIFDEGQLFPLVKQKIKRFVKDSCFDHIEMGPCFR